MRTDNGTPATHPSRPAQDGAQAIADRRELGDRAVELVDLPPGDGLHVRARTPAGAPNLDDLVYLMEADAQPARPGNEIEHGEHSRVVHPVPRRRAARRRHDPGPFVEPERAPAQTGPPGHLSDEETTIRHAVTINLAPWGKVKTMPR